MATGCWVTLSDTAPGFSDHAQFPYSSFSLAAGVWASVRHLAWQVVTTFGGEKSEPVHEEGCLESGVLRLGLEWGERILQERDPSTAGNRRLAISAWLGSESSSRQHFLSQVGWQRQKLRKKFIPFSEFILFSENFYWPEEAPQREKVSRRARVATLSTPGGQFQGEGNWVGTSTAETVTSEW